MPLLNTTPATGRRGMLRNENRVTFHWRLLAVVFWELRRYPCTDKIDGVLPDGIGTFISDILPVCFGQFESRSELGFFEGFKGLGNLAV